MSEIKTTEKNLNRHKHAEPFSSGNIRKTDNFKLAFGTESNWIDLDTGRMYHIQEYMEKLKDPTIPKDKKPTTIKVTDYRTGKELEWLDPVVVSERMKDPEPDPRY